MNGRTSRAKQSEPDLCAEQVRLLYEGAPTAALANMVNAAILAFLLWDVAPGRRARLARCLLAV